MGENWLQIVAINEHAPPTLTGNPAGLIYKLEISYELFQADLQISKSGPQNALPGDIIEYTFTVRTTGRTTPRMYSSPIRC